MTRILTRGRGGEGIPLNMVDGKNIIPELVAALGRLVGRVALMVNILQKNF